MSSSSVDPTVPQKNMLITGGAGRIAEKIAPVLAQHFNLTLVDCKAGEVDGMPVHVCDISKLEDVLQFSQGIDVIVHMAIASSRDFNIKTMRDPTPSEEDRRRMEAFNQSMIEVNLRGTYHIYEAARINQVPQVVFFSSLTTVLGVPSLGWCTTDDSRPNSLYAATKLFGEDLADFYSRAYGITIRCIRLGQPFPWFGDELKKDRSDRSRQSLVHFNDIAPMVLAAAQPDGPKFGIYYGLSETVGRFCDLSNWAELGYRPSCLVQHDASIIENPPERPYVPRVY